MKKFGYYVGMPDLNSGLEKDVRQIVDWINRLSEPVTFTVLVAGTEVEVSHGVGKVPASVIPSVKETDTGQGVIYPGTTAWTNTAAYLTATVAGNYSVLFRR